MMDTEGGEGTRDLPMGLPKDVAVSFLAISPNGQQVAASSFPAMDSVHVWDVASEELRTVDEEPMLVACAFPDCQRLITAPVLWRNFRVWNMQSGKEVKKMEWPPEFAFTGPMRTSPDGNAIAAGEV